MVESLLCLAFVKLPVLLTELVDSASRVDELPARVEGMAFVTDFNFDQRVFVAVFPLHGFFCLRRRLAQERIIVAHVLKNDESVVLGMDAFFHDKIFGTANVRNEIQLTYSRHQKYMDSVIDSSSHPRLKNASHSLGKRQH